MGLALDNLSDPQNIGAIYRSAYTFNVDFILTPINKNPLETSALVTTSSGAFEKIETYFTNNLNQAIAEFKKIIGG